MMSIFGYKTTLVIDVLSKSGAELVLNLLKVYLPVHIIGIDVCDIEGEPLKEERLKMLHFEASIHPDSIWTFLKLSQKQEEHIQNII